MDRFRKITQSSYKELSNTDKVLKALIAGVKFSAVAIGLMTLFMVKEGMSMLTSLETSTRSSFNDNMGVTQSNRYRRF